MKKIIVIVMALVAVVLYSCKKEYEVKPADSVKAVLTITQDGVKSTLAQGDTLKKDRVAMVSGQSSTGPIQSYTMSFGDGTGTGFVNVTSNDQIYSSHIWNNFGQYLVTLTVFSGQNGSGTSSSQSKTIWVVDTIPEPPQPADDILILEDSTWNPAKQEWTCKFRLNVDIAFWPGCTGPFYYKGDQNNWGTPTALNGTLQQNWYYFTVTAGKYGHRFTVIIYNNISEMWAVTTPDVHQNEYSMSKWNVYGCFEVIGLPQRITPAYTPGIRGDQQVSLEPSGSGYTKINIKDLNFRWSGSVPGINFLKQTGWITPIPLTANPADPYGRWSYTVVKNSDFYWSGNQNQGVCFFQLYSDYNNTSYTHIWTGSYFYYAGNPSNTPPIPVCFSFQATDL